MPQNENILLLKQNIVLNTVNNHYYLTYITDLFYKNTTKNRNMCVLSQVFHLFNIY